MAGGAVAPQVAGDATTSIHVGRDAPKAQKNNGQEATEALPAIHLIVPQSAEQKLA